MDSEAAHVLKIFGSAIKSALSIFFAAIAVIFCAMLTACGVRETPAEKAANDGILLIGNAADPATLDPSLATGFSEYRILAGLFEGLVGADTKNLTPIPAVAKSWKISPDKKTYTFYLDENAKWSDGSPVSAHDFVFAWQRTLNPKVAAEYASMLFPIKNAEAVNSGKSPADSLGLRAISDGVLEVELEKPTPYFLSLLYHNVYFPLPRKVLEKFGASDSRAAEWTRPQNMVSNGAFTLSKWSINDRVSIRKNPSYRAADSIHLNGVEFFPVSNLNTEDRAFRAGQLHLTDSVAPSRIDGVRKNAPETLKCDDWLAVYYYIFNTSKPPFDNADIRRAFSMSIDRRAVIDSFLKAGQKEALSFVPPDCGGYELPNSDKIKFDVAQARKILSDAGYPDGKGFPRVRLTYNTSEQHKPIAEALQQMWKKNLGVDVELFNVSWPAYLQARRDGDFDIARASWIGDFAAPESFLQIFESSSGLNHTRWTNARYDSFMKAASESESEKERMENLEKAEALMIEQSPILPLYFYSRVCLISPMLKNWENNILDYHDYKGVRLDSSAKGEVR